MPVHQRFRLVGGPEDRLEFAVGLIHRPQRHRHNCVTFTLDPHPNPHTQGKEQIELTMVRAVDKIFGIFQFEGTTTSSRVSGEWCFHNASGYLDYGDLLPR